MVFQIGFMNECLDFWNFNLKGKSSLKQENAPKLIWYQCKGSVPPVPLIPKWPGTWYSRNNPMPDTVFKYYLNEGYLLDQQVLQGVPFEKLQTYKLRNGS